MSPINSQIDRFNENKIDLEKHALSNNAESGGDEAGVEPRQRPLWFRFLNCGVEEGGIAPVPVKDRKDTRIVNLFTVWFTMLLCLLP
jgi:hypothetical protein